MSTCPSGHESASDDYCDVCGLPIPAGGATPVPDGSGAAPASAEPAAPAAAPSTPSTAECPNCQAANPPNALFCEACGYDFTTGSLPRPVTPSVLDLGAPAAPAGTDDPGTADAKGTGSVAPAGSAAESIAPPLADAWVAEVWIDPDWYADQESTDPLPSAGVPTVVPLRTTSILVGRTSRSRGIHPDIDLATDNGISRRHCQLTTDGTRWWVEDLGSSNGTYLGSAVGPLPKDPVPAGEKREIAPDARVYLGAWTRIVIRRAQPGEV
ncbi:FHA domain-containing protein [Nocardioides daeguensis]|uniref:FHA domain-containing protein n=1 Tax=Nocardioides daeguensis TaxID=908359 RepID=UPI001C47BC92|nr:FHA domain-containing protein [Nocardioides daeguensis]MBV6729144.1 FHA domain-containing protein [Nocardioides daeguensis]MCR1774852.1 FHA domain-containing protein [Nocardioides daeguensis]